MLAAVGVSSDTIAANISSGQVVSPALA
jgi:hypothetical protein